MDAKCVKSYLHTKAIFATLNFKFYTRQVGGVAM